MCKGREKIARYTTVGKEFARYLFSISIFYISQTMITCLNLANYDDVTTQLYWGSFAVVGLVNIVVVNVDIVALFSVTDHITFSCSQ